jgi:hypothetical protein
MDKRGILIGQVIFIILNITFFIILMAFVLKAGSGALVLEQVYAKQIGLIIDGAKPKTAVLLDVVDAVELAEKNKVNLDSVFRIVGDKVVVSLKGNKPYSFQFYSDYKVDLNLNPVDGVLTIIVGGVNG